VSGGGAEAARGGRQRGAPMSFRVRPAEERDREWMRALTTEHWGAEFVVVHGTIYRPHELPGFVAEEAGGQRLGLATYTVSDQACELVTLNSLRERAGVGAALLDAVAVVARNSGCTRLWLVTTNDNLAALAFYQKRGLRLVAVYRGAVDRARVIKPSIPLVGAGGIPIRDELELELRLAS
jgi:ribosomal protein S18 acetylase RimI-like enzyme